MKLINVTKDNREQVILLTTSHDGKHIYEKIGFKSTGKCTEGEELYCLPVERML